jgi:hypothetical protein
MAVAALASWMILEVRSHQRVVVAYLDIPLPDVCLYQRILGHPCPGCGLTRSVVSLAHGDLPAAWSYNPAGLLVFAVVLLEIPYRAVEIWRSTHGKRTPWPWPNRLALGMVPVAIMGQWLVRCAGSWLG